MLRGSLDKKHARLYCHAPAKCYQATVELADTLRVLTEEMLRDYLAQVREHVEVDVEEYARQRLVDAFQMGWNIEREFWEEEQ